MCPVDDTPEIDTHRIRETIEELVEEKLDAALGAGKSERVGADRVGYRHGARERTLTTSLDRRRSQCRALG
jgi:transposase-like protein